MERKTKTRSIACRNVPEDVYRQFKILCATQGFLMGKKLLSLIEEYLKKNKK